MGAFLELAYDHLYRMHGELYAPQRMPLNFPGLSTMKHIYFLRDPRDVLVPGFHSFAFTHKPPRQPKARTAFETRRKALEDQGLEACALKKAETWIKPVFSRYRQLREEADSILYLSYDDFLESPANFMEQIATYLGVQIDKAVLNKLAIRAAPVTKVVQNNAHKRSGRSGQFKTALTSEMQLRLNGLLAEKLAYWNFDQARTNTTYP